MILLDSSVIIELFRSKSKAKTVFYKLAQYHSSFSISAITYYEVGIGNRKSHFDYWENLTRQIAILPFDRACANRAIDIYLDLLKSNKMIDLADILIGATALTHNIPIATLNSKHFERIKNLEIFK